MFIVGTQRFAHPERWFIGGCLWRPATRRDHLCSPTVPSRLGIKAVDGAVAHDIVFTGLLYYRYKFTILVHLFSSSFSLGRNSGIKFWLSLLTYWFLSLDVSVSLTLA